MVAYVFILTKLYTFKKYTLIYMINYKTYKLLITYICFEIIIP